MTDRRHLIEGLNPAAPPSAEEQFIYHGKPAAGQPEPSLSPAAVPAPPIGRQSRSPVSTRIRTDYAEALKRASLERQMKGQMPYTVQDILEAALEPWLKGNGYLS